MSYPIATILVPLFPILFYSKQLFARWLIDAISLWVGTAPFGTSAKGRGLPLPPPRVVGFVLLHTFSFVSARVFAAPKMHAPCASLNIQFCLYYWLNKLMNPLKGHFNEWPSPLAKPIRFPLLVLIALIPIFTISALVLTLWFFFINSIIILYRTVLLVVV